MDDHNVSRIIDAMETIWFTMKERNAIMDAQNNRLDELIEKLDLIASGIEDLHASPLDG